MPDFDLTCELSLKIELHMLRPITEKVHSGNGPVSLVTRKVLTTPLAESAVNKSQWAISIEIHTPCVKILR